MVGQLKNHLFWRIIMLSLLLLLEIASPQEEDGVCTMELEGICTPCCSSSAPTTTTEYDCNLPGLQDNFQPGQYDGITINYLSFVTNTSSPNLPIRAKEFEKCTGGTIVFSDAANVWEDPVHDLGTKTSRGSEVYDGYFMSYSHFPEVSSLGLAEHLNDRIRKDNARLKWEDVLPQVRTMGEYRKDGQTYIDFLMYDGDFFVPIIRLDLLEKFELPLPNTWEEVVEYAKFFNGTDLNESGENNGFGFCHYPRLGAGYWDWWWAEAVYSTWATYDQTRGRTDGFFFDEDSLEPRVDQSPGFRGAAEIWKDLWTHGSDGCISPNFVEGRCAIGFAPPGCWKKVFLNPDGVSRKDANGTIIWRPTMKDGTYAEPYRFKPFGTRNVVDRDTGQLTPCTKELCPKAEPIPERGHHGFIDRANKLRPSPYAGQLVNRAPFYWSGGLGTLIRKSSPDTHKDMMWDFFVYTNSPDTAVDDVANYASWLDSWRYSQLSPGLNFLKAGWSEQSYEEHKGVMQWALSRDSNGAFNLRIPGSAQYTRDVMGEQMKKYISGSLTLDELTKEVTKGWNEITMLEGKLDQLEIYRAALGLDAHSEVELCRLHRTLMDEKDPSVCRRYDPMSRDTLLVSILIPVAIVAVAALIICYVDRKRRNSDSVWKIRPGELHFEDPPEVLGRGTFGLVLLAEYRGTQVAVKRVIPPKISSAEQKLRVSVCDLESQVEQPPARTESVQLSSVQLSQRGSGGLQRKVSFDDNQVQPSFFRRSDCLNEDFQTSVNHSRTASTQAEYGSRSVAAFFSRSPLRRRNRFLFRMKYGDEYGKLKLDFVEEMQHLSKLRHPCVTTVMGAVIASHEEPMLVMEYMDRGSLYDILHNDTFPLEGDLILPILRDIAQGLRFLHAATPKVIHGDLKSQNILVDSRFRAKVADFGLSAKKTVGATGTPLWMAPELLRGGSNTTESDVYSFGIILYEIMSRKEPYENEDLTQVLKEVADPKICKRPALPPSCPPKVAGIMTDCVGEDPELRPAFDEIDMRIKRLDSKNVEPSSSVVSRRRKSMQQARSEGLLFKVFPKHIAEALRDGRQVEPEKKDVVTIFFSDIVGFTTIATTLSPEKVADLLDRLYTKLDAICNKYDCHKMETIGDAYMCVTNLVEDQRRDHVKRMAEFAIDAVKAASETPVCMDDQSLGYIRIRVGLHCGPVIASVVGTRLPKYAVFGDTVNVAARMESNSLPGQIQCSEVAAELLRKQSPDLSVTPRGIIGVKGKGDMKTYFVDMAAEVERSA